MSRREDLVRLLQLLWARNATEHRAIEQLFGEIESPRAEEVSKYSNPDDQTDLGPPVGATQQKPAAVSEVNVTLGFTTSAAGGIAVPRPRMPVLPDEAFVLTPQPPVTQRSLTIVWRRFQKRMREGPAIELDLAGSIAKQCRVGRLLAPVMRPSRRNQARLVVLIDASPSMAAWNMLAPVWEQSLAQGQLRSAAVYYFSNASWDVVYRNSRFRDPIELDDALRVHTNSALLIFSDAGAARGYRNRHRTVQTKTFLSRTALHWSPVVWINPMPEARWRSTTAASLAGLPKLQMLALSDTSMIRAIDLLRGVRAT
jgi:uncharacterized protein with von Willebrand factor type A (vWA) domain